MQQLMSTLMPKEVAGQMVVIAQLLMAINNNLAELANELGAANARAQSPDPMFIPVSSVNNHVQSSNLLDIIGFIASGDTAGLYGLQINHQTIVPYRLATNQSQFVPLDHARRLSVGRGLPIGLTGPGAAVYEAVVIAVPRVVEGAKEA